VALSVVLALARPATIVSILGISWGAIGSVFLGPFLWGLFLPRLGRPAAISGSLLALAICLALYFGGWPSPSAGTVGMLVSLAAPPILDRLPRRRR
jgi:Na+/proline symporter